MTHMDDFFVDDDDMAPSRNKSSIARRVTGVLALVASLTLIWATWSFFSGGDDVVAETDYVGEGSGEVTIVVARGDSLTAIGTTLADAGVVLSVKAFVDEIGRAHV